MASFFRSALFLVAAVAFGVTLDGCGGSAVTVPAPRASATPVRGASPSPSPTASGGMSAAAAQAIVTKLNTAEQDVSTYFATLPHTDATSDVAALAAHMAASPAYKAATVTPGGISATLADGTPVFVYADHLQEDYAAAAAGGGTAARARRPFAASTPVNSPTAAFLVNQNSQYDVNGNEVFEFSPDRQAQFAQSFVNAGIPAITTDTDIESMLELAGSSPGLDYLSIATHGGVLLTPPLVNPTYLWIADDLVTVPRLQSWAADISAGNIGYGLSIYQQVMAGGTGQKGIPAANFYFTPGFLSAHLHFNPGAIVDNESCLGANLNGTPTDVGTLLSAAPARIGRYIGWSLSVKFEDADQTDAFLVDRLTGENDSDLAAYVTQRDPLQRPFSLDAIQGAMSEQRSGSLGSGYPYTQSPAYRSNLVFEDFGGETVTNPPVEYGLPSIERMQIAESSTGGTLTITGTFPGSSGTVTIADPAAGASMNFTPSSWTAGSVVVTIPASGNFSKGDVTVTTAAGVTSNAAPITQWSGTFSTTQNESFQTVNSDFNGSGSGTIVVNYTVDFRSDVHPEVPAIDTTPVPQNLTFAEPEADSQAVIASINGSWADDNGNSATFGLADGQTPMAPTVPPAKPGFFGIGAVAGQPAATCNNSLPGPQPGINNVFCPAIGYKGNQTGTCTTVAGTVCDSPVWNPVGIFGSAKYASDGTLTLTMDPASYAITVATSPASGTDYNFQANPATDQGSATGSVGAPIDPPGSTPAQRSARRR